MKRLFIYAMCLLGASGSGWAQTHKVAKETAVKIADRILDSTTYDFKNTKTGEIYSNVSNLPLSMDVQVNNKYNNWHYTNGVTNIALLELADQLGDKKYEN